MATHDGLHGAYRRRYLIAQVGKYQVDAAIARGALRRLWPNVVVESERMYDPLTRAAAALLAHGPRAAISGPTAAPLHGCAAIESAATHVTVPYGHPSRSRDGLAVHNGPLPDEDVVVLSGLRVLSLERVVSDLLCVARPRDALAVTDQALAAQPPEWRDALKVALGRRLRRRADPRGTRSAARLLSLATGRAESPAESWLLLEVVDLGFPPPEVNWSLCSPSGRELYRLDLAWPDHRVALEYNGYAVHAGREAADQLRADDLRRRGWIVIMASVDDLRDNRQLEQSLRQAFASRGGRRPTLSA
jgi:hypothetical protein